MEPLEVVFSPFTKKIITPTMMMASSADITKGAVTKFNNLPGLKMVLRTTARMTPITATKITCQYHFFLSILIPDTPKIITTNNNTMTTMLIHATMVFNCSTNCKLATTNMPITKATMAFKFLRSESTLVWCSIPYTIAKTSTKGNNTVTKPILSRITARLVNIAIVS